jgi:hypothetical protein
MLRTELTRWNGVVGLFEKWLNRDMALKQCGIRRRYTFRAIQVDSAGML